MKLIFLLVFMLSCATQTLSLKESSLLPYKEASQVSRISEGLKPVKITKVLDKREHRGFGKAFTGVQYAETPIMFDQEMSTLVKDYFTNSLHARGIVFAENGVPLEITVNKIWVEEVIEKFSPELARCHVDMEFHINLESKKWSGDYWTKFTSPGDLADGTERLAPTLASCLNEISEKLVNDKKFINMLR